MAFILYINSFIQIMYELSTRYSQNVDNLTPMWIFPEFSWKSCVNFKVGSEKIQETYEIYPQKLHEILCQSPHPCFVKSLKKKGFLLDLRYSILYNLSDIF